MANKSINSSLQASSIKTLNNDDIDMPNASRNNFNGKKDSILRHNSDISPELLTNRTNHGTNVSIDMGQDSIMSIYSKKVNKTNKTKKETQLRPFATKMIKVNRLIKQI